MFRVKWLGPRLQHFAISHNFCNSYCRWLFCVRFRFHFSHVEFFFSSFCSVRFCLVLLWTSPFFSVPVCWIQSSFRSICNSMIVVGRIQTFRKVHWVKAILLHALLICGLKIVARMRYITVRICMGVLLCPKRRMCTWQWFEMARKQQPQQRQLNA